MMNIPSFMKSLIFRYALPPYFHSYQKVPYTLFTIFVL